MTQIFVDCDSRGSNPACDYSWGTFWLHNSLVYSSRCCYCAFANELQCVISHPILTNVIVQEKIRKLVDIWDKGQTFPAQMVESFKQKLQASMQPRTFDVKPQFLTNMTNDECNVN